MWTSTSTSKPGLRYADLNTRYDMLREHERIRIKPHRNFGGKSVVPGYETHALLYSSCLRFKQDEGSSKKFSQNASLKNVFTKSYTQNNIKRSLYNKKVKKFPWKVRLPTNILLLFFALRTRSKISTVFFKNVSLSWAWSFFISLFFSQLVIKKLTLFKSSSSGLKKSVDMFLTLLV